MVGGDHPDCWGGAIVEIYHKSFSSEWPQQMRTAFFTLTSVTTPPVGDKVTFKVRKEEGPPACKAAKATSKYLGVI